MSIELSLVIVTLVTFVGILSGLPIAYVFGACCILFLLLSGNLNGIGFVVPASLRFMQGFAFLAIPMYMILGCIMEQSGLAAKLFIFAHSLLGRAKGAFGSALVIVLSIFGAMSGSAASAIAALGPLVIPEGPKYGYDREHITGLVACASLIAMLIPPSITMIAFGVAAKLSIALLFLATAIPGILTAIFFIVVDLVLIRRWGIPVTAELSVGHGKERLKKLFAAWPTLLIPFIVLGGIYSGVFTPTEAAVVAVAWILFYTIGAAVFSGIKKKSMVEFNAGVVNLAKGFIKAGKLIGALGVIIFFMFALSRAMIFANVNEILVRAFTSAISNKYVFLLVANVVLIIMGMLMDDVSGCVLAGVFLVPIAVHFGVNPIHFGAIVGVNLGIGNLTPPVAPLLYLAAGIGNVPIKAYPPNLYVKVVTALLFFGQLPVLILVTYIPQLSLFLPGFFMR